MTEREDWCAAAHGVTRRRHDLAIEQQQKFIGPNPNSKVRPNDLCHEGRTFINRTTERFQRASLVLCEDTAKSWPSATREWPLTRY